MRRKDNKRTDTRGPNIAFKFLTIVGGREAKIPDESSTGVMCEERNYCNIIYEYFSLVQL